MSKKPPKNAHSSSDTWLFDDGTPALNTELVQIRPPLATPAGISKSMAKALACPTYFTGQYLQPTGVAVSDHFLGRTGTEFHEWRRAYIEHLVTTNQYSDTEYREQYVNEHPLSPDAIELILRDSLAINPESVFGAELFLSVDRDFRPLELELNREPGQLSANPNFLLSGTIDLLLLDGPVATIRDPKSGFSTATVSDDEPAFYALLVMAHFPLVEEVQFIWDFVRVDKVRRTSYRRQDLAWIQDRVRELNAAKDALIAAYNNGETLDANPFSGLCPYCQLQCPLRPRWEAGELALAMPQNRGDAIRLAQLVKVCEDVIERAKSLVVQWLDQDAEHHLPLGAGWEATIRCDDRFTYPLGEALQVLGLDLIDIQSLAPELRDLIAQNRPAYTPLFDVPLGRLHLSGLSPYLKTKKSRKRPDGGGGVCREKMRETLARVADRSAATTLLIRKQQTQELIEAGTEG